jgi:hypothetical protein
MASHHGSDVTDEVSDLLPVLRSSLLHFHSEFHIHLVVNQRIDNRPLDAAGPREELIPSPQNKKEK